MKTQRGRRYRKSPATAFRIVFWLSSALASTNAGAEDGQPGGAPIELRSNAYAISGNPAFTEYSPGSGALGKHLMLDDWGVKFGGVLLSDVNNVFSGGAKPGSAALNNVLILGVNVDAEKRLGWKGLSVGVNFLQFNGQNTNGYAGSVPGYNSIVAAPPFHRTELYQYWVTQELVEDVLKIRVGKSVPAVDFNNVTRANKLADDSQNVASLSSLLYTSIFVNPTLLGAIGGYYDSVFGATAYLAIDKTSWLNAGVYDGNKARGIPTGIHNPRFNNYVFGIAEVGTCWVIGQQQHPGQFGMGAWYQSGRLKIPGIYGDVQQTGTGGFYFYGGQRVWAETGADAEMERGQAPKVKSVTLFYQYGMNTSKTLAVRQFVGVGATAFAMIDGRPDDSFGFGTGLSFLNQNRFQRPTELMFQAYYQAVLAPNAMYLQPTLTYIPTPGALDGNPVYDKWPAGTKPDLPAAFVGTLRLMAIF